MIRKKDGMILISICIFLILSVLATYHQVSQFDFVNFDDDDYVIDNPHIRHGFTWKSVGWALTATYARNWHPVTWLSHILDIRLYGVNPGKHHLTSLMFHVANSVLLFLVLQMMSGNLWPSGLVAALFALHPCHVESVAWVAERKDVLCAFFWMLTLASYARYTAKQQIDAYLPVFLFCMLALMAKPMAVTLPFVLLLMDYWPLNRIRFKASAECVSVRRNRSLQLLWEKTPLFVLTAVSVMATYLIQRQGGAVASLEIYPVSIRIGNALLSYLYYIGKMIWPTRLAVYYPYPDTLCGWQIAVAGFSIAGITLFAIRFIKRFPWFAVGWFWYLGTMVPVIGLVQVGSQSMADRYTYIPSIGLFIIFAWTVSEITRNRRILQIGFSIFIGCMLLTLMRATWIQAGYWQDSSTLFRRALQVTENNFLAHHNLGVALSHQGKNAEAVQHYKRAIQLSPNYTRAHYNLGLILYEQGKTMEAIRQFLRVIRLDSRYPDVYLGLGNAMAATGKLNEAIRYYSMEMRLNSGQAEAHNNLGVILYRMGKLDRAIPQFKIALWLNPEYNDARNNLAQILRTDSFDKKTLDNYGILTDMVKSRPENNRRQTRSR